MKKIALAAAAALALGAATFFLVPHASGDVAPDGHLRVEPLAIMSKDGKTHVFNAEIADTPVAVEVGLMFRREMAPDHGMLFIFPGEARVISFWMKNTLIPLDMVFIAPGGEIVKIAENTTPQSLDSIPSERPVTTVLELNGGTAARLGIAAGDTVVYPYNKE